MFGMLDYRAHKLYLILFGIPNFIIMWLWIIGIPLLSYHLAFAEYDLWVVKLGASLIVLVIAELLSGLVSFILDRIFFFLFTLIVDVIPHDGRTQDKANEVVRLGATAITLYETNKNPAEWSDNQIEELVRLDWIARLFYSDRIRERCNVLRSHFKSNPGDDFDGSKPRQVVEEAGVAQGFIEGIVSNKVWRLMGVRYGFFVYLIVFNPSGY